MRHSDDSRLSDQTLAVTAEALFLLNLLALPGLAFLALLWLWRNEKHRESALVRCHLGQALRVSLWGGAILVLVVAAILLAGSLHGAWTWMAVIIYFTCIHSTLVLFGIFGLAKAMAGKTWSYPLIGSRCDE